MIEFGVLGPLTVHRDGRPVVLNATMLRGLLALLLHRPGKPVSVSCIVDTLWPGRPPASVRKIVQVYVGRLRKALGDEQRIRHSPDGYPIVVGPDELDITRFRARIDAGRDAAGRGELTEADRLLTEALGLWRGRPFRRPRRRRPGRPTTFASWRSTGWPPRSCGPPSGWTSAGTPRSWPTWPSRCPPIRIRSGWPPT